MNVWVAGMPQFKIGDQVVVFLRNQQDGTFDVVGLNQGKYEIVNELAVANVSGVTLLDGKTGQLSDGAFVIKLLWKHLRQESGISYDEENGYHRNSGHRHVASVPSRSGLRDEEIYLSGRRHRTKQMEDFGFSN